MRLPLPAELIDHIFSFLRGDIPTLKACFEAHPILSQLSEQYLFADIVVGTADDSKLYQRLSKDPHILHYPRTLEILAFTNCPELFIWEMMPRMANLVSLTLAGSSYGIYYTNNKPTTVSILRNYLQQSSVKQICLTNFRRFPLSILDNGKNIKKLTLSDCNAINEPKTNAPHQLLEELSIRGCLDINLLNWLTDRVANLKSLYLVNLMEDWTSCPELLLACSSSLTELHLDIKGRNSIGSFFVSFWISENQRFYFNLSGHKCLKRLSISGTVLSTENGPIVGFKGALAAIPNLIKTAPVLQEVLLRLHWVDPTPVSLGRLDYSNLFPGISRIHLCISGANNHTLISPASILKTLAGNESLMDLVNQGVVILEPRSFLDDMI